MKSLKIGHLEAPIPIVQGGMGVGISLSRLASAVANQGGIGVIATVGIGLVGGKPFKNYKQTNLDALRTEIRKARQLTKGILGVNIMVAMSIFDDMVKTSIEEGIDLIFCGAGLPLDIPKHLTPGCKTQIIPIVSSARAASVLCNKWKTTYDYLPAAIVVEGPKAGGHLGFKEEQIYSHDFQLEKLIPEVVSIVKKVEEKYNAKIPVLAAGGIFTGADIRKFMELGASGVQMGTRFVATHECDASDEFKQKYIDAQEEDIRIIKSPVGMPGRAISNPFLDEAYSGERRPKTCPYQCLKTCVFKETLYCIADALIQAQLGNLDNGFAFSGSNSYRLKKIISVEELIKTLKDEYLIAELQANKAI